VHPVDAAVRRAAAAADRVAEGVEAVPDQAVDAGHPGLDEDVDEIVMVLLPGRDRVLLDERRLVAGVAVERPAGAAGA
jgi:hypothetical protein